MPSRPASAPATASRPATARQRARAEITSEILRVARRTVAEEGAATLSLRAIARELGMVSSAIYRYFPSRDDLLTHLIVDGFGAFAAAAETGDATAAREDIEGRIVGMSLAMRAWALANPNEYGLLYGTPVPGYVAPEDTIDPARRVSLVPIRIMVDGVALGVIDTTERISTTRGVRSDLARLRELAPGVPDAVLVRGLGTWTQTFGHISYELFGHFDTVIGDRDAFFELQVRRMAALVIGGA